MSVSIDDFWKLLTDSLLLTPDQCRQLSQDFGAVKGAVQQSNARTLAEWLIAQDVITRYQAKILLAGRPGPFVYGEYHVCELVKHGPLAGAFRAKHAATNHPVTLIFLTGTAVQAPRIWSQIAQRVTAYCEVVHPHLARCYEVVDLSSFKFVVMEGFLGQSLDQVLSAAGGRFAPHEACRIARQAAIGLGRLHQAGHARGDIRPGTLWMEPGGNIKLPHNPATPPGPMDLAAIDPSGRLLAQADYLAPELLQAAKAPDALTDIYALGCMLYTLLAGQPPFTGGSVSQKMGRHATEPIRPLDATFGVPQPISQVVSYLMAKNPEVRYQTAVDVANALGSFVDHSIVTPLPAMAVPTLPAFENAIMAKRARQAAQFAAPATSAVQTPSMGLRSPIPVAQVTSPGQPSGTLPTAQQGGATQPTPSGDAADGTTQPQVQSASRGWMNRRNLLIATGVVVISAFLLGVASCRSCTPATPTDDAGTVDSDDEGTPTEKPLDSEESAGPAAESSALPPE